MLLASRLDFPLSRKTADMENPDLGCIVQAFPNRGARKVSWLRKIRLRHRTKGLIAYVLRLLNHEALGWVTLIFGVSFAGILVSWTCWEFLHGTEASPSTTIRNMSFVVGGIVALFFALWRSRLAERQADTGQRGLLNERYQKGAEMLGSGVLSVRMGGIYALQRLAEDNPKEYAIQILGLFCAFVRHPTRDESTTQSPDNETEEHLREDVGAIMAFIGYRNQSIINIEKETDFRLDLRDANLYHIHLRGANLSKAILNGANLSKANLARADLSLTQLENANLSDVSADHANCLWTQFTRAQLTNIRLVNANCSNASMFKANLSGAILVGGKSIRHHLQPRRFVPRTSDGHQHDRHSSLRSKCIGVRFANPSDEDMTSGIWTTTKTPITGLTQSQLDINYANPSDPPKLAGVNDAETGAPLVWRGRLRDFRENGNDRESRTE